MLSSSNFSSPLHRGGEEGNLVHKILELALGGGGGEEHRAPRAQTINKNHHELGESLESEDCREGGSERGANPFASAATGGGGVR